jgi:hypothetical protein
MKAERLTYTIGEDVFVFRPIRLRDIQAITGRLGILPTQESTKGMALWRSNALNDELLCLCSKSPKLTMGEVDGEVPEGSFPVVELPQATWSELILRLAEDSGIGAEATDEVRPSSGTEAPSEDLTS